LPQFQSDFRNNNQNMNINNNNFSNGHVSQSSVCTSGNIIRESKTIVNANGHTMKVEKITNLRTGEIEERIQTDNREVIVNRYERPVSSLNNNNNNNNRFINMNSNSGFSPNNLFNNRPNQPIPNHFRNGSINNNNNININPQPQPQPQEQIFSDYLLVDHNNLNDYNNNNNNIQYPPNSQPGIFRNPFFSNQIPMNILHQNNSDMSRMNNLFNRNPLNNPINIQQL